MKSIMAQRFRDHMSNRLKSEDEKIDVPTVRKVITKSLFSHKYLTRL